MNKIKVLLVNPQINPPKGQVASAGRHLGLSYIASLLRRIGHNVRIVDAILYKINTKQLVEIIIKEEPNLIGITVYQGAVKYLFELISMLKIKKIKAHITIGGALPTVSAGELLIKLQRIDSAIIGEGEYAICELAECLGSNKDWTSINGLAWRLKNKVVYTHLRPLICDLDLLPFPATDSLHQMIHNWGMTDVGIISSRGCYGNCTFCHVPNFYKNLPGRLWRARKVKNVVDEIESLINKWPVNRIE